jgi:hypothetical protein
MTKARVNADNASADIQGVTAGTGLTGGGTSGTVTLTNDMATTIAAKGDLVVGTGNDTYAALTAGTNGQVLKANSATATGLEWAADSSGMANPMTTTGDVIYSSSGSTPARLGIGSSGQVLTVSGGVPTWATPSGAENWTLLNAGGTALTGSQTVTVSGISGREKILLIISNGSSASASSYLSLRLNGDTGANYNMFGGVVQRESTFSNDVVTTFQDSTTRFLGPKMSNNAASIGNVAFLISGCNSSGLKIVQMIGGANSGGGTDQQVSVLTGFYNSASTISSVSAFSTAGNWDAGTMFVYATN